MCVHLIDSPPGEQARSGRLGMDLLELELGWSSRETDRLETGEGEAWDQKRNPDWRHDPCAHAVGGWVKQSAIVNEWSGLHVVPCSTVWWSGSQAARSTKCGIACSRLVGSIGKGDRPLKRPGDRGSLKPKSCPGGSLAARAGGRTGLNESKENETRPERGKLGRADGGSASERKLCWAPVPARFEKIFPGAPLIVPWDP